MCLAQRPQRSDASEARTRGPSVSSQALYRWATALPQLDNEPNQNNNMIGMEKQNILRLTFYIHRLMA